MPSQHASVRSILILPVHLPVVIQVVSDHVFPSILYAVVFASVHATCPAHFILLDLSPYFYSVWQIRKLFVMRFPPSSCYILPHSPKYLRQYIVLILVGVSPCILGFWH